MSPKEWDFWMTDFLSVQAFQFIAGSFFANLGARPESFWDREFSTYLPPLYNVLQATKDWINWDQYLRDLSRIQREWWKRKERGIITLKSAEDLIENDLDHLILWWCLVAHVYDPNKRWLTDENRVLRTRALLMFLLHESDELVIWDKTPHSADYDDSKAQAIKPTRILLEKKYWAHPILLDIWDEFNAQKTELSRDIDFLDHETTIIRALRYTKEFSTWLAPSIVREFVDYYKAQHADHPDVKLWERYYLEYLLCHMPIPGLPYRRSNADRVENIRASWQELYQWWNNVEKQDSWLLRALSNRITGRVSCLLPS